MASISASHNAGVLTVTGSGYVGVEVAINVQFIATDNRRRFNEMHRVPVVGGAISFTRTMPFATGTAVARALSTVSPTWPVEATSLNVSV